MVASLDFETHLQRESARFLSVLSGTAPGAGVPSCPQWSASDLLWHLGEVQWFWATVVERGLDDPEQAEELKPERPADYAALVDFFARVTSRLADVLRGRRDDEPAWTWSDDQTVGFVRRRQAHEALIHRLDAELTAGAVTPLDGALASDGVDETLRVMFGGVPDWGTFSPEQAHAVVETTDTGASWAVRLGRWAGTSPRSGTSYDEPAFLVVDPTMVGAPRAVVRGSAADLDAWLWGRVGVDRLHVDGDRAAFASLQEVVASGIQ